MSTELRGDEQNVVPALAQEVLTYFVDLEQNFDDKRAGKLANYMEIILSAVEGKLYE